MASEWTLLGFLCIPLGVGSNKSNKSNHNINSKSAKTASNCSYPTQLQFYVGNRTLEVCNVGLDGDSTSLMVMIERKRLDKDIKDRKMLLVVLSEFNHSALCKFFMVIQKYLPWSLSFYSLENNPDVDSIGTFLAVRTGTKFQPILKLTGSSCSRKPPLGKHHNQR